MQSGEEHLTTGIKLTPKYFMFLGAIINGIVFLFQFPSVGC